MTARLFTALDAVVAEVKPDWVLAQGDTTTVFVAAMEAFYRGAAFGHVEAGLRTGDKSAAVSRRRSTGGSPIWSPMPTSRRPIAHATRCWPKVVRTGDIHVTGNTVIDALYDVADRDYQWDAGPLAAVPQDRRLVLITAHRRESFGTPVS